MYRLRVRFKTIFDEAGDAASAERRLSRLFAEMVVEFPGLDKVVCTFGNWHDEILNYFNARKTSGPVEGINNKARVIVKRCYGIKSAQTIWTRLILDLNRVQEVTIHTIADIRQLVAGFRAFFTWLCT